MQFDGCYCSNNSSNIMEAISWKLHTGATWRDIPEELCPWKTAYNRFNRWAVRSCGINFFKLRGGLDQEWVFIDGSCIRTHQHASGARHGFERAIGLSRGGRTTKSILQATRMDSRVILKSLGG